jgi:hypothetical protein
MKIEKRGKYPGVKVHLEPDECALLVGVKSVDMGHQPGVKNPSIVAAFKFTAKLGEKIRKLQADEPDLLEERTLEQIREELELELRKAKEKLEKLNQGQIWNK